MRHQGAVEILAPTSPLHPSDRGTAKFSARAMKTVAASCALLALVGCGDLELPTPPDMSGLNRAYEEPDGELTSATAAELGVSMAHTVTETQASSPIELMGEMVTDLQETGGIEADPEGDAEGEASGESLLGERLDVAAIVRLNHKCRGWEGADEGVNGTLGITATLDSGGLIPTLWGKASGCRLTRHGNDLELDGNIGIRIGNEQPRVLLREIANLPYLVEFEGTAIVERDGERAEVDLHTNFRVMPNEEIQLLIALPDGTYVVGVFDVSSLATSTEPVITGGLLTRDERWSCTLNLANASGSCADANDPTSTIEW